LDSEHEAEAKFNEGMRGDDTAVEESSIYLLNTVIYLDWRLSALAVDLVILQPEWRGFEAVERLERRICLK
jgi:hypothetical protein